MAIQRRDNVLSQMREDCSDLRSIESAVSADFDTSFEAFVTGAGNPYVINGFALNMAINPIGGAASNLQVLVSSGALMHVTASQSGTIYLVPAGTPAVVLNAATVPNVSGAFIPGTNNYVGIDYYRFQDPTTDIQRALWDPSTKQQDSTIAPAAIIMNYEFVISPTIWASNILPIAVVLTDSGNNVVSITDSRPLLFRLGTGYASPNPFFTYPWPQGNSENPTTTTSNGSNPFYGGDKAITDLKDWMNAVMTELLYLGGGPYWYSLSGIAPTPASGSVPQLREDAVNTIITGSGNISNGILPNALPILITTGNISATSNQLTSLASFAGLAAGDYIFGNGIPAGTTIVGTPGSTITMSQEATLNITGVTVTFYSPSAITSPGQINWDEPINVQVIGSELAYVIAANPTSTDVTLADDEVAYITLVRDVAVGPNLIFTSGSPTVTSVGAIAWTSSGLLSGDYVKVTSDTHAGYYEILTVNSSTTVTLTTNVLPADNYPGGTPAQYAYGSYLAVASPITSRDIFISTRETVPINPNTFWLFAREDDGGIPTVYIRLLGAALTNGESVPAGGGVSQELLNYIGSPSQAASAPQYVAALDPGSAAQVVSITSIAGTSAGLTSGQYFYLYSSADARTYAVWISIDTGGSQPSAPGATNYIEWSVLSTDTAVVTATKLAAVLDETNAGDFSAVAVSSTITVTNNSAGTATAPSVGTLPSPFAVSVSTPGTGQGNFVIQDGNNLTLAIKKLDLAIGEIQTSLNDPNYDESLLLVASSPSGNNQILGPISSGTNITIPLNSRMSNVQEYFTVGFAKLEVFLNGQKLIVGIDYTEVGATDTVSDQINILINLVVGDDLEFLTSQGGGAGSGGGPAGPVGPVGPPGANAAGGPVSISIKTSSYLILSTDCFLAANCTSAPIIFTLPPASANTGRIFYMKKIDSSANSLTIAGNGSDTIDGSSTLSVASQWQEFSVISFGSSWWIF